MLKLFYPASFLRHKNHFLLNDPLVNDCLMAHDIQITLTINESFP